MRVRLALLVCALCAGAVLSSETPASAVQTATDSNIDSLISGEGPLLVMFYANWDEHSQEFFPTFERLASSLLSRTPTPIRSARLDISDNDATASRFHVSRYPSLVMFNSAGLDHASITYGGPLEEILVLDFVDRSFRPAVTVIKSRDDLDSFRAKFPTTVVGCFPPEAPASLRKLYEGQAAERRFELRADFAVVEDAAVAGAKNCPCLMVAVPEVNGGKAAEVALDAGKVTGNLSMSRLLDLHTLPLLGEIGAFTFQRYFDSGLPMGWLVMPDGDLGKREEAVAAAKEAAREFRDRIVFMWLDDSKYHPQSKLIGVPEGHVLPWVVVTTQIRVGKRLRRFVPEEADVVGGKITAEGVRAFCQKFLDGKAVKKTRSMAEVGQEEQDKRDVKFVVASNFDKLVVEPHKDVVVKFFSSSCEQSRALAPIYEKFAHALRSVPSIVFAEFETTDNDLPEDVDFLGVPAVVLFPANNKSAAIENTGFKNTGGMWEFVQKSRSIPFGTPKEMEELLANPPPEEADYDEDMPMPPMDDVEEENKPEVEL